MCDGTVRREESGLCDIDELLLVPALAVIEVVKHLLFGADIILYVEECHEPVFRDQLVMQSLKTHRIAHAFHLTANNEIDQLVNQRHIVVIIPCLVALGLIELHDLFRFLSEDVDIVIANQLVNLDIRAILCSQRDGSIQHELHVAGSRCFLRSEGDLLGDVRCRNDLFRLGNVVILNHNNLKVRTHLRIHCGKLLQAEDQMNNILRNGVCRSRLSSEDHRDRALRKVALLNLKVFIDGIKSVHLLALVLMQALDLYVKDRVHIQHKILRLIEVLSRLLFVVMTDFSDLIKDLFVIVIFHQLFQLHRVLAESGSDQRLDICGKLRVGGNKPTAEGNAIRLIVEFLRIKLIEILQLRLLENLRVKRCNAVDGMSIMDIHGCHVHQVVLVNNVGCLILYRSLDSPVKLTDDRKKMRYGFLQVIDRPFLQSFRQDGVVGVGAGLRHNRNRLIHGESARGKQTNQLRNYHGRMGIIDLYSDILVQLMDVNASFIRLLQDQLCGVAYHEILLINPKNSSIPVTVVRIQEKRQISLDISLVKIDAVRLNHTVIDGIQVKQMQPVALAGLISRNVDVIHRGFQGKSAERHLKRFRTALQPAVLAYPGIDHLMLLVVQEFLTEQAVMIVQPHAVSAKI